ncbi:MAG: GTP-dependent dephospho-CoA kinase family protein [Thermoprotei archaeon]
MGSRWIPNPLDVERMRHPFGQLYPVENLYELKQKLVAVTGKTVIASVGDVVSSFLLGNGINPEIIVFDGKTLRGPTDTPLISKDYARYTVRNEAGSISQEAMLVIRRLAASIKPGQRVCVQVDGEEDLLALPLIAYLDASSIVIYGQPREGVVMVTGNAKKQEALIILERMQVV